MNENCEHGYHVGRCPFGFCNLDHALRARQPGARTVTVDGFDYATTAPERTRADHYERLAEQAQADVAFVLNELATEDWDEAERRVAEWRNGA